MKQPDWNKNELTYGEIMNPAMEISDPAEAKAFLENYATWLSKKFAKTHPEAMTIARTNIGYWTGYCSQETAERAFRVFDCSHPIFGRTFPDPQEALAAGLRMGKAARR